LHTAAENEEPRLFTNAMLQGINRDYATPLSKPMNRRSSAVDDLGDREERVREGTKLLCEHFGISVGKPDLFVALAYCLMAKHVPFFAHQSNARRGPKGLDLSEISIFFVTACEVGSRLHRELGRGPSKVELSAELLPALKRHKFFKNKKNFGPEAVRKYLAQIDTAMRDYRLGKATEFQRILVEDVREVLVR